MTEKPFIIFKKSFSFLYFYWLLYPNGWSLIYQNHNSANKSCHFYCFALILSYLFWLVVSVFKVEGKGCDKDGGEYNIGEHFDFVVENTNKKLKKNLSWAPTKMSWMIACRTMELFSNSCQKLNKLIHFDRYNMWNIDNINNFLTHHGLNDFSS